MNSTPKLKLSQIGSRLRPPQIMALMNAALENPDLLSLAAGFTDTSSLPVGDVRDVVNELASRGGPPEFLQYGTNRGRPGLRELLAERSARLDGASSGTISAGHTLIGNGSQQLLYLAMQVLCDPGDIVLVEQPTYFVFLEMLSGLGIRPVSLPAAENLEYDVGKIEDRLNGLKRSGEIGRVKAIYLMSYFANPSGICRGLGEKRELAELLVRFDLNVPVIEDAAYRDLWFDEPCPAPSVLSMSEWQGFHRLYLGTLTKPYSSGLKVGYAHASDGGLLDRMNWAKGHHDFGTANFNQAVLEAVLADGRLDRHLESLRLSYRAKMFCLHEAFERFGLQKAGWKWRRPTGGLNLWARAPDGLNTSLDGPFWKACIESGVFYVPGSLCFGDSNEESYVRLSYGVLDHASLERAAERFAGAAATVGLADT